MTAVGSARVGLAKQRLLDQIPSNPPICAQLVNNGTGLSEKSALKNHVFSPGGEIENTAESNLWNALCSVVNNFIF